MKVVLTGPKCSGKSRMGKLLSQRVPFPFFETDDIIEQLFVQETGKPLSCRTICSEYGEDFFRGYERRAIEQVAEYDSCIISTGGSALLDKRSRELLRKNSVLVLLYASKSKLLERVSEKGLPAFLKDKKNAKDLFVARANLVVETLKPLADIVIDSSKMNAEGTLSILINNLKAVPGLSSAKTLVLGRDNYATMLSSCKSALETTSGFVLIPTETVYGLACLWDNELAKNCIYRAKARPEHKPFQMLADSAEMAKSYGCIIDSRTEKIVNAFCPGPITIVVPTSGMAKVGFRIPKHKFVRDLISFIEKPLAATSANISGEAPALNIESALSTIKMQPTLAIDGGVISNSSIASTVIEVVSDSIKILRKGPISLPTILKVLD